jgi:hypothetical protein
MPYARSFTNFGLDSLIAVSNTSIVQLIHLTCALSLTAVSPHRKSSGEYRNGGSRENIKTKPFRLKAD